MNSGYFEHIFYNLYEVFFERLDQHELNRIQQTSRFFYSLVKRSGGFVKAIKFDKNLLVTEFINRLSIHKRIESIDIHNSFDTSVLHQLPIVPKILIIRNPNINNFNINFVVNAEYLFIINDDHIHYNIDTVWFPTLKFIGLYNTTVETNNHSMFVMNFENLNAVDIMISKSYKKLQKITKNLEKIYKQ